MTDTFVFTVEQFTQLVNDRHVNHLDRVLDDNVTKLENGKAVYRNIAEAREYYSMEHEAHPAVKYEIVKLDEPNEQENTLSGKIRYNNHIYDTVYWFSNDGKIQKLQSKLAQ